MVVRAATLADVPSLRTIERASPEAAHWSESQYEALFAPEARRETWVAVAAGAVAGFIVARVSGPEWEIENVAVTEAFRRQGVGARLLDAALRQARSERASTVFLEVRRSNMAAQGLYQKAHFQESGVRNRYYREPTEDAIVYRLDLQ